MKEKMDELSYQKINTLPMNGRTFEKRSGYQSARKLQNWSILVTLLLLFALIPNIVIPEGKTNTDSSNILEDKSDGQESDVIKREHLDLIDSYDSTRSSSFPEERNLNIPHRKLKNDVGEFQDSTMIPALPNINLETLTDIYDGEFPIDPETGMTEVIIKLTGQPVSVYKTEIERKTTNPNSNFYSQYEQQLLSDHSAAEKTIENLGININIEREFTQSFNGFSTTIDPNHIQRLKKLPYIAEIYPNHKVELNLDLTVPFTNVDDVWNDPVNPATGNGIIVGVIDTGIDYNHPDLNGGTGGFPNSKVVGGRDFYYYDEYPEDQHGHGTHVAGIIAGTGVHSVRLYRGVAYDAKLYICKVFGASPTTTEDRIIDAIDECLDPNGDGSNDDAVHIISMSLGGLGDPDDAMSQAVDTAVDSGVVVVVAAGNSGDYGTVLSPGCARKVITVGSSTHISGSEDSGGPNMIAYYSSRGPSYISITPETTYGLKPDVLAPGGDASQTGLRYRHGVVSARADGTSMGDPVDEYDEYYTRASGTSMAAPHVSGIAALILEDHIYTPAQVKSAIMNTGIDLGYDVFTQGAGRVDALEAVETQLLSDPSSISFNFVTQLSNSDIVFENVGTVPISDASVSATCYLFANWPSGESVDPPEAHNDYVGLSETTITIGTLPDNTYTVNLYMNIPSTAIQGWYGGTVVIDDSANVHLEIPYFFILRYHVTVTSSDPYKIIPIEDPPIEQIDFPVNVENTGGFDQTYDLIVDLPIGLSAVVLNSLGNPITEIFLASGDNDDFTLRITTSSSMSKYLQEVKFIARSQSDISASDFVELRFVKPDEIKSVDWIISSDTIVNDWTILLNGNLLILEGYTLTFDNVGLIFNTQSNGEYSLRVGESNDHNAGFFVDMSSITVLNPNNAFKFQVNGGIDMEDSEVSYLWGDSSSQRGGIEIVHDTIQGNRAQILNSKISNSQTYGLYLQPRPAPPWINGPLIQGNEISNNGLCGIYLWQVNIATISENDIFGNGWYSTGTPSIDNARSGIKMSQSSPTIIGNSIENNIRHGIHISSSSFPTINNNDILNHHTTGGIGICIKDVSSPTITGNTISNAMSGIYMKDGSYPIIDGNILSESTMGIWAQIDCYPTISNNLIKDNKLRGIFIESSDSGNPIIIIGNTITHNGGESTLNGMSAVTFNFQIAYSTNILIENNEISYAPSHYGLYIQSSSDTTVFNNLILGNPTAGLVLFGGGPYEVKDNTFLNNGDVYDWRETGGIVVRGGVNNCEIRYNRFESNKKYGIYSDGEQEVDAEYNYFGKWKPTVGKWHRGGIDLDVSDHVTYDPLIWGGTIDTDVTWTVAKSPYIVGDDLTVADGVTMTIELGVTVKFTGDYAADIRDQAYYMRIYGELNPGGSVEQVTFTRDDRVTPWIPTQWSCINLQEIVPPIEIVNCDILYANLGLTISTCQVSIIDSTIRYGRQGICIYNSPMAWISNTYISDIVTPGDAIEISWSPNVLIENCEISDSHSAVNVVGESPGLEIRDTVISNIISNGIDIDDTSDGSQIIGNTLINVGYNGFRIGNSADVIIQDNVISFGTFYGIVLDGCTNAMIRGNSVGGFDCGVYFNQPTTLEWNVINDNNIGIIADDSSSSIISNTINDNSLYGIKVCTSYTLAPLIDSNTITGNGFGVPDNEAGGIYCYDSASTISHNLIEGNKCGIYAEYSTLRIVGNTISGNNMGVSLSQCTESRIYHNNFISNGGNRDIRNSVVIINYWYTDAGGDYGGNFWDDYQNHIYGGQSAVDNYDGLKADLGAPQTGSGGSDGVWDWSYDDQNVEDWYPFVEQTGWIRVTILNPPDGYIFFGCPEIVISGSSENLGGSISSVQISINGGLWQLATDTSGDASWSTWEYIWKPSGEGDYTITARAIDEYGNYQEDSITITFLYV